ncbi:MULTISPECIES: Clp protease N-terminal domain-containing protein [Acidithrix]|uniref:Clp protease N-terminal domain-containing protein n=1 Tax=Acidithrix TaxID=1609233 RepID=UPI001364D482|nr:MULTISPECIES: Clp protease N-terminal domain-containing protein [Acidithrix]
MAKTICSCFISEKRVTINSLVVSVFDDDRDGEAPDRPASTTKAKKVLELTARAARGLGHDWIVTEHLSLGLIIQGTSLAGEILLEVGVTRGRAESVVIRVITQERQFHQRPGESDIALS